VRVGAGAFEGSRLRAMRFCVLGRWAVWVESSRLGPGRGSRGAAQGCACTRAC